MVVLYWKLFVIVQVQVGGFLLGCLGKKFVVFEKQCQFVFGVFGVVVVVGYVFVGVGGEVGVDGVGGGVGGVGCVYYGLLVGDGVFVFQCDGDDWFVGDEVYQFIEERMFVVFVVVLFGGFVGYYYLFEVDYVVVFVVNVGENFRGQVLVYVVGFDYGKSLFYIGCQDSS